jgi:hypothetical protein
MPKPVAEVIAAVVAAAKAEPNFGVPGMARFKYARETDGTLILARRNGKEANIAKSTLATAIKGVRADNYLYISGPGAFQKIGVTHVSSPIYALLRLLPLNKLIE